MSSTSSSERTTRSSMSHRSDNRLPRHPSPARSKNAATASTSSINVRPPSPARNVNSRNAAANATASFSPSSSVVSRPPSPARNVNSRNGVNIGGGGGGGGGAVVVRPSSPARNVNSRNGIGGGGGNLQHQHHHSVVSRSKQTSSSSSSSSSPTSSFTSSAFTKRSVTPVSRTHSQPLPHPLDNDPEPGRVRVAIRIRPKNSDELSDPDYADCVELQPELKRLKLRKNNWSSESYRFDDIFTESASQKRIYEVVAKPVVESVLNGYNGTIMAYGQTGTGKTYTLGRMGKDEVSERGIMVRSLEDIITSTSSSSASVEISYLQLYLESIQDLLAPEKINIPVVEDAKTGEVLASGATLVKIQSLDHFLQQLQIGEANRHAANTKMNTESSRSHAILMVYVRRPIHDEDESNSSFQEKDNRSDRPSHRIPIIRKSKLLIVDLAGSERLDKAGSEGHLVEETKSINLSLTSLGKCINALAENSSHIPTRDSKLTRLLRDSFGGSARTSLIITIGPSSRHHAETTSTIMFGQRAMKIVNSVKLKEEFDYESLCRKLETQIDHLTAAIDRQQKLKDNEKKEMERKLKECQNKYVDAERSLVTRSELMEKENTHLESEMKELMKELNRHREHNKLMNDEVATLEISVKNSKNLEKENSRLELELENVLKDLNRQKDHNNLMRDEVERLEMSLKRNKQHQLENSSYQKILEETTQMYEKKIGDLIKQLEDERACSKSAEEQKDSMKKQISDLQKSIQDYQTENSRHQKALAETSKMYEERISEITQLLDDECTRSEYTKEQLRLTKKQHNDHQNSIQTQAQKEMEELKLRLQEMHKMHEATVGELQSLRTDYEDVLSEKETLSDELQAVRQSLSVEEKHRKAAENELVNMKKVVPVNEDTFEEKRSYSRDNVARGSASFNHRSTIAKICEEVGLQKILTLLRSEDIDVQIHAVKVVANLAAEDSNQEKIVHEGGLDALLMLLQSSQNITILRVASGAVANLAMNEMNQGLITSKGGSQLLSNTASRTDDPQTLRMVAGAIANLCGNEKLHAKLKEDGAIKALLGMARSGNIDVIAQVARGLANFAKCESRGIIQGNKRGRSHLMEDDSLPWLLANSNNNSSTTRRHIELAFCHLAQNEDNAREFVSLGGLKELVRISNESTREDIRNLAKKTIKLSPTFQSEMRAQ